MKKTGRPQLGEKKKTHRVGVFFTAGEFAKIQRKAGRAGLTEAEFLWQLGLGREVKAPPETVNFAAVKEINAIGKNLNSLVRAVLTFKVEDAAGITNSIKRMESSLQETIGRLLER
jgi:hypothetical protein